MIYRNGTEIINKLTATATVPILAGNITAVQSLTAVTVSGSDLQHASLDSGTAVGDLIHILSGTGVTAGYYRITAVGVNQVTVDRAPGGAGTNIILNVYKDVLIIQATDATNGQFIGNFSAQNKPLQIGGHTYVSTSDLTSEDIVFGGEVKFVTNTYIGDSANAKSTLGLTINQAGNDDEIISLKSSDVGHTVTDDTETDTYGLIKKYSATAGGLLIRGLTDSDAAGALVLEGIIGATDPTDTNSPVILIGSKQSANTTAALGAAETVFQLKNRTTNLITVLGDGSRTQPASTYHNFGATIGTSGYGLFDNGGVLQYKNSGVSWVNVGSTASTYGAELVPALTEGNWTIGAGWENPIVGPGLIKDNNGTGTMQPNPALTIVAGNIYELTYTIDSISAGGIYASVGATGGSGRGNTRTTTGTFTEDIEAKTTANLIFTPTVTGLRVTISAVSLKLKTLGASTVDGLLTLNSSDVRNPNGLLRISPSGIASDISILLGKYQYPDVSTTETHGLLGAVIYADDAGGALYKSWKARGTFAAPATVVAGEVLTGMSAHGHDGTSFAVHSDGAIIINAEEEFTATNHPTYIQLQVTPQDVAPSITAKVNSARLTSESNWAVGVSHTSPIGRIDSRSLGNAANVWEGFHVARIYSNTYNAGFLAYKSRGDTTTPSAVVAGDYLNYFAGFGYDVQAFGTTMGMGAPAAISIQAAETFDSTHHGSYITFGTTPLASTTRTERYRIDSAGVHHFWLTPTDGTNYEGLSITPASGNMTIAAETAGTGADNVNINFMPAGTGNIGFGTTSPIYLTDVNGKINSRVYYSVEEFDDEVATTQFESGKHASEWVTAGTNYAAGNVTYTAGPGGTLKAMCANADNDSVTSLGIPNYNTTNNPVMEVRVKIDTKETAAFYVGFASAAFADVNGAFPNDAFLVGINSDNGHTFGATQIVAASVDNGAAVDYDDMGVAIVSDTYVKIKIDLTDTEQPRVWINDTEVAAGSITGTVQAATALAPYFMVQNLAGGAIQRFITLDYFKMWQDRG